MSDQGIVGAGPDEFPVGTAEILVEDNGRGGPIRSLAEQRASGATVLIVPAGDPDA